MNIVKVKLKKLSTEDGLCRMVEGIPIGKEYEFDLDNVHDQAIFNTETGSHHVKQIIFDKSSNHWLPTGLLEMPAEKHMKSVLKKRRTRMADSEVKNFEIINSDAVVKIYSAMISEGLNRQTALTEILTTVRRKIMRVANSNSKKDCACGIMVREYSELAESKHEAKT